MALSTCRMPISRGSARSLAISCHHFVLFGAFGNTNTPISTHQPQWPWKACSGRRPKPEISAYFLLASPMAFDREQVLGTYVNHRDPSRGVVPYRLFKMTVGSFLPTATARRKSYQCTDPRIIAENPFQAHCLLLGMTADNVHIQ